MPDRKLRLGEELISPLHALYDGLQVDGAPRPAHRAAEHPVWVVTLPRRAQGPQPSGRPPRRPAGRRTLREAYRQPARGIGEDSATTCSTSTRRTIPACARWSAARSPAPGGAPATAYRTDHRGIAGRHGRPRTGRPDGRLRDPADHRGDLRAAGHSRGRARTRPPVLGAPGGTAVAGGGPGPGRCAGRLPARAARGQAPAASRRRLQRAGAGRRRAAS